MEALRRKFSWDDRCEQKQFQEGERKGAEIMESEIQCAIK